MAYKGQQHFRKSRTSVGGSGWFRFGCHLAAVGLRQILRVKSRRTFFYVFIELYMCFFDYSL